MAPRIVENVDELFSRLNSSLRVCPNTSGLQKFLPLDDLDKIITKDNVKAVLSRKDKYFNCRLPEDVVQRSKKVFAILVLIGRHAAMKDLLKEGISDEHLPLLRREGSKNKCNDNILLSANPKAEFHTFATLRHEPARFTDEFLEKQWVVQAPILDFAKKKWLGKPSVVELKGKIDSRCPLPFLKMKDLVNISATVVNEIDLHPAHLQGFPAAKNKTPLTVAVKHFNRIDDFNKERINLEKTGRLNNPNLIHHLAMYQRENFFCIMFPWADGGDLRKFWKERNSTQRTPALTLWSLRQMLGLSSALAVLHNKEINCRHGDLKPDNILHFSNDGKESLVIADFGISSFHANVTIMRAGITQSKATTPAYQAPEAGLVEKGARSRRYDIWSLGCIFLEFAIWLMYDVKAIHSFKYARKDAPYQGFYDLTEDGTSAIVHPIVSQALNDLRLDDRSKDDSENGEGKEDLSAIGALLDLIEKHLLLADVNQRDTAEQVHAKLKEIVQKAEKRSSFLFRVDSASESAPIFRQDVPADFEEELTAYTSTG